MAGGRTPTFAVGQESRIQGDGTGSTSDRRAILLGMAGVVGTRTKTSAPPCYRRADLGPSGSGPPSTGSVGVGRRGQFCSASSVTAWSEPALAVEPAHRWKFRWLWTTTAYRLRLLPESTGCVWTRPDRHTAVLIGPVRGCRTLLAPSTTSAQDGPMVAVVLKSKASPTRISTAVRLPHDLHAELQRQAEDRDVSVNFLVTRAVDHYLRQLPPADPLAGVSEPASLDGA